MKLVTSEQMRDLEKRANEQGNSYAQMMERAGTLTAHALEYTWNMQNQHVLALIGPGNNGGDGLVCARVLHDAGAEVELYLYKRGRDASDTNWMLCVERGIAATRAEDDVDFSALKDKVAHADFILDALLGTGVSRPIEGTLRTLLDSVRSALAEASSTRASDAPFTGLTTPKDKTPQPPATAHIVALDLPSGLNPDTGALDPAALPAELTVTYAFPKVGHYTFPGANAVGELMVADIGIPATWADSVALNVATADEIRKWLPPRPRDGNKGTFGKTMVACGSLNYTGAPVLAARGAGRSGSGLVTLAVPQSIHSIIASKIDEATFLPLPDRLGDWRPRGANELLAFMWDSPYDALLVGCGLGRTDGTRAFLERLLEGLPALENPPLLIIDADGLNNLADSGEWWSRFTFSAPPILTPHPGEMARLLGTSTAEVQANRVEAARHAATEWNAIVVLKGAYTVIASPDGRVTLIPFANPALATAGTGDVLAGIIAGLTAQWRAQTADNANFDALDTAYNTALAGAFIHALAGEMAVREVSRVGLVAGDLLPRVPQAMEELVSKS